MPIGNQQNNNFLRLTLDVWQDKVFHNEKEYPAGYFAASILNTSMDEIWEMLRAGDVILGRLFEISSANKEKLSAMLPSLKEQVQTLTELLLKHSPFCFHDKEQERHLIEVMFSPKTLNDLSRQGSETRNFFLRYLKSIVRIPPAIYHFYAAGRFFELDYLRRLKKATRPFSPSPPMTASPVNCSGRRCIPFRHKNWSRSPSLRSCNPPMCLPIIRRMKRKWSLSADTSLSTSLASISLI